jgi:hypothetical protein
VSPKVECGLPGRPRCAAKQPARLARVRTKGQSPCSGHPRRRGRREVTSGSRVGQLMEQARAWHDEGAGKGGGCGDSPSEWGNDGGGGDGVALQHTTYAGKVWCGFNWKEKGLRRALTKEGSRQCCHSENRRGWCVFGEWWWCRRVLHHWMGHGEVTREEELKEEHGGVTLTER